MSVFTQGQSIAFLEEVFGRGIPSNGGQNLSVLCPRCELNKPRGYNKKKLVVRTDTFVGHCWVCGLKAGSLYPILKKYKPNFVGVYLEKFGSSHILSIKEQKEDEQVICLPPNSKLLALHQKEYWREVKYLKKERGLIEDDFWYWKFLVNEEEPSLKNRVIIPSFDADGNVNYWTGRKINDRTRGRKYQNPQVDRKAVIFNELNIDWSKELIVVEGPFDMLKCPPNTVALLGSELDDTYLLFQRILENRTPVILSLDLNAKHKETKIAKCLASYEIIVKTLDIPKHYDDIGEMSKEMFNDLLGNAKLYTRASALNNKIRNLI